MELYFLFFIMASATILSPGPGVMMTLTNALSYGLRGTFGGILGIAVGALVVAAISATSLGLLLASSAIAFTILKIIGACYLIYLGIKLWRAPPFNFSEQPTHNASFGRRFLEGLVLQLTNPKPIFFFLSIFPQFIVPEKNYALQFTNLTLTYSFLAVVIHTCYAFFAIQSKHLFASNKGSLIVNKTASATFIFFGITLAATKRSS